MGVIFILSTNLLIYGQNPDWYIKLNKLEILKSSKNDVGRIFNDFKISKSFIHNGVESAFYESSEGELSVNFSAGGCSFKREDDYNVEKGKVLEAIFFPKEFVKLSKFRIDKNKFEKHLEDDNPTLHYINQNLGIDYGVQKGKVIHIKLFPSANFENLRCSKFGQ